MTVPAAPTEAGGSKIHFVVDDNAGTNRANLFRGYKNQALNSEQVADLGVYPTSGTTVSGKKTTSASTATQLTATSVPCQGMLVKASKNNTDTMWVGISTVTAGGTDATDGYPLEPGESVGVPCRNANTIYIRRNGSVDVTAHWVASAD